MLVFELNKIKELNTTIPDSPKGHKKDTRPNYSHCCQSEAPHC